MALALGRKSFPKLGGKARRPQQPKSSKSRQVKFAGRRTLDYMRIKAEVLQAIASLNAGDRDRIPAAGTLPEQMVALALVWLHWYFQSQIAEDGGRMRMGGSVVDFIVYGVGGKKGVIIRCQGNYWHSQPDRKLTDAMQFDRLHRIGYLVSDVWEHDIYQAWVDGRLKTFVEQAVLGAA